jgi:excisionase family DNA binding protein
MKTVSFFEVSPDELINRTAERVSESIKVLFSVQTKNEDYLTAKEVSRLLKVSLPTLWDYCKRGFIPSYRIGGSVRFKRSELEAIINKGIRFKFARKEGAK